MGWGVERGVRRVEADLDDLLLKTSRTFALSIPLLPEPTRGQVGLAYLAFRIADTLEDATRWEPARQVASLARFAELLERPSAEDACVLAQQWTAEPPLDHAGYRELLAELPWVMERLRELPEGARELIVLHTRRTAQRMAGFVERRASGARLELRDLAELQDYCYAVAGIVGEMLTELFLLDRPALAGVAAELRRDAAAFGEALQLVNILKDSATDAGEGRSFLPVQVPREQVFDLARRDLVAAAQYVARLHAHGAPRGIVEFTALPVLLARATLDRVERRGPGAKLNRLEVASIVRDLARTLDRGQSPL